METDVGQGTSKKYIYILYKKIHWVAKKIYRYCSFRNHFKCAVFFKNLEGSVIPGNYSWLGALPDIFKKKSVRNSNILGASLNGVTAENFDLTGKNCSDRLVNAKCAAYVSFHLELDNFHYKILHNRR